MAIKIKKISPKDFGKALYKFTGAQQLVDSGKALSKCKPKDAKCIAKNLGNMAMAAKGLTPAGLASTVAKNVIKDQIKKKIEAEKAKKAAKKKLEAATSEEEKKAAQAEIDAANKDLSKAEKQINENEAVVQKADAEKLVALQELEKAKLDPATAKQADAVERQALAKPGEEVPPTPAPAPPALLEISPDEPRILGLPKKIFYLACGFMAFILFIVLLK
jgi:hypothetical protein